MKKRNEQVKLHCFKRIYVNGKPFGFQPKYGSSILPIRIKKVGYYSKPVGTRQLTMYEPNSQTKHS